MFARDKDEKGSPCMGFKKVMETHKRVETLCVLAIGISIIAIVGLIVAGGRNAAR